MIQNLSGTSIWTIKSIMISLNSKNYLVVGIATKAAKKKKSLTCLEIFLKVCKPSRFLILVI